MDNNGKTFPWSKAEKDDSMMKDVYGGPEYFEKKDEDGDNPMTEGVYAGPEYFGPTPEQMQNHPEMFMCVYAGPEYYNRPANGFIGMMGVMQPEKTEPAQPVEHAQEDTFKRCPCCGAQGFYGKFCPECGTPCPSEDSKE